QARRVQPLSAGAACHDGDIADALAYLRYRDAREQELKLPTHLRWRKADQVQSILIRDEAKHGRAIAPIAVRLPHIGYAAHDIEGLLRDGVQLRGIWAHHPKLYRERRIGSKHELGDAHICLSCKAL